MQSKALHSVGGRVDYDGAAVDLEVDEATEFEEATASLTVLRAMPNSAAITAAPSLSPRLNATPAKDPFGKTIRYRLCSGRPPGHHPVKCRH